MTISVPPISTMIVAIPTTMPVPSTKPSVLAETLTTKEAAIPMKNNEDD